MKPALSILMKPASGKCNMCCDYCFYADETMHRNQSDFGFMSEQTLKNIIRKTMPHASRVISFAYQGGEPSLRGLDFYRQAVEYQKHFNKNGIQVLNAFQTNGLAIDEGWARFFAENDFLVGLSIDGTKDIHDSHRKDRAGSGTYDRILEATKLLDKYNVKYNILTVVTKEVADNIDRIYEQYKKNGWEYQQYILCLEPISDIDIEKSYELTVDEYGIFLEKLFNLWYEDYLNHNEPYIRQLENYVGILNGFRPEACEQCGVCGDFCVVEADGSVYPCDFYMMDEYRLGNFNDSRYPEIQDSIIKRQFIDRSRPIHEDCKNCSYYNLCRNGCFRHRIKTPSGIYKNRYCQAYKYFFEKCSEKMLLVARGGK